MDHYTRRSILKATGVSVALPFMASLPSIARGASLSRDSHKRMVFIHTGLGMHPGHFFPRDFGQDFTATPVLEPLSPHRGQFTVFSHIDHPNVFNKHGGIKCLLNGVSSSNAEPGQNVSVDQLAASHLGYTTRFPSVRIGLGGGIGASYSLSGICMREDSHPHTVFRKLFINDSAQAKKALAQDIAEQGSILDLIRGQARRLSRSVNANDRDKLDEYLTAIREAEQKLQGLKKWQNIDKPQIDSSAYDLNTRDHGGMDYAVLAPLMFDVIYLGILSDSSRIFTAGFGIHNKIIELDGVTTGYHSLSHHGRRPDKLQQLQIIERFYIEQMSSLMTRLQNHRNGTENLLDDTMIFFGSGISDAARHSNRDLPVILAGGGFSHQGHVDMTQPMTQRQTPLNNLFTSMLQQFGMPVEKFNDATGDLNHLLLS